MAGYTDRICLFFPKSIGHKDRLEIIGDACLKFGRKAFGGFIATKGNDDRQIKKISCAVEFIFLFLLTLPLSTIVSLSGLAFIALSNTHRHKFKKLQYAADHVIKPVKPNAATTKFNKQKATKGKEFLQKITTQYKDRYASPRIITDHISNWFYFLNKEQEKKIKGAWLVPDQNKLSNILLEQLEDKEVFFIPFCSFTGRNIDLSKPKDISFLIDTLKAAFESGKKLVVTRFGSEKTNHCISAGFSRDGRFIIINSTSGKTFGNISKLASELNQAKIKDHRGEFISFTGEYVNTKIQRDGRNCVRFATLYCYQMLKRRDLNAFEEVNGAFIQGKLKTFEDYKMIDGSTKVRTVKGKGSEMYANFMKSWSYRMAGIKVDDWQQISLDDFIEGRTSSVIFMWTLKKGPKLPECNGGDRFVLIDQERETIINSLSDLPIEQTLPLPPLSSSLGSLFTDKCEKLFLFCQGDNPNTSRLVRLLPGQQVFMVRWNGDREQVAL